MNLGKSLKIALAIKGKNQKWMADKMKTSQVLISRWSNNPRFGWDTLESICRILGYKVSEFIALGED